MPRLSVSSLSPLMTPLISDRCGKSSSPPRAPLAAACLAEVQRLPRVHPCIDMHGSCPEYPCMVAAIRGYAHGMPCMVAAIPVFALHMPCTAAAIRGYATHIAAARTRHKASATSRHQLVSTCCVRACAPQPRRVGPVGSVRRGFSWNALRAQRYGLALQIQ